jgi:hypothetical protein
MGTRDVTAAYKAFVVKHASLLTTFESVAQVGVPPSCTLRDPSDRCAVSVQATTAHCCSDITRAYFSATRTSHGRMAVPLGGAAQVAKHHLGLGGRGRAGAHVAAAQPIGRAGARGRCGRVAHTQPLSRTAL